MTSEEDIEFQRVVAEGLVPKIDGSSFCVSLVPQREEDMIDAKFCVELGVMIMMNKPIITVAYPGQLVPPKLLAVSDHVIEADISTDEGRERLSKMLNEIVASYPDD